MRSESCAVPEFPYLLDASVVLFRRHVWRFIRQSIGKWVRCDSCLRDVQKAVVQQNTYCVRELGSWQGICPMGKFESRSCKILPVAAIALSCCAVTFRYGSHGSSFVCIPPQEVKVMDMPGLYCNNAARKGDFCTDGFFYKNSSLTQCDPS